MINVEIKVENVERVQTMLEKFPKVIESASEKGADHSIKRVAAHVKYGKLSGQVLNVRSGRLRDSIKINRSRGSFVSGGEYIASLRVADSGWYGMLHEYGVRKTWTAKPPRKVMSWVDGGGRHFLRRHPGLKTRSFLRTSAKEMTPVVARIMALAINHAVRYYENAYISFTGGNLWGGGE